MESAKYTIKQAVQAGAQPGGPLCHGRPLWSHIELCTKQTIAWKFAGTVELPAWDYHKSFKLSTL